MYYFSFHRSGVQAQVGQVHCSRSHYIKIKVLSRAVISSEAQHPLLRSFRFWKVTVPCSQGTWVSIFLQAVRPRSLSAPSVQFSSVQFSCSVMSDSLQPHESQHARPPCPSPTPRVHSDFRPLSQWCHPVISSSVVPFSSCPQSLPASESFPISQLFPWGGPSTGVSASASFPPKNPQGWSPSEWTGWISLQSKGLSRVFSNTTV